MEEKHDELTRRGLKTLSSSLGHSKLWSSARARRRASTPRRWWSETWWRWRVATGSPLTWESSLLTAARWENGQTMTHTASKPPLLNIRWGRTACWQTSNTEARFFSPPCWIYLDHVCQMLVWPQNVLFHVPALWSANSESVIFLPDFTFGLIFLLHLSSLRWTTPLSPVNLSPRLVLQTSPTTTLWKPGTSPSSPPTVLKVKKKKKWRQSLKVKIHLSSQN